MIAAAILLSIAGTTLLWSIINGIVTDNGHFLGSGLVITGVLCFVGIAILFTTPTNNDVRKGEAHYVEQNHIEIVKGDTVLNYTTYEIQWIK